MQALKNLDLFKTIVFCLSLICATVLVAMGKIPSETLKFFLIWLLPSPLDMKKGPDA